MSPPLPQSSKQFLLGEDIEHNTNGSSTFQNFMRMAESYKKYERMGIKGAKTYWDKYLIYIELAFGILNQNPQLADQLAGKYGGGDPTAIRLAAILFDYNKMKQSNANLNKALTQIYDDKGNQTDFFKEFIKRDNKEGYPVPKGSVDFMDKTK